MIVTGSHHIPRWCKYSPLSVLCILNGVGPHNWTLLTHSKCPGHLTYIYNEGFKNVSQADIVPFESMPSAMNVITVGEGIALMLGPIVAGKILDWSGKDYNLLFCVGGVSMLATGLLPLLVYLPFCRDKWQIHIPSSSRTEIDLQWIIESVYPGSDHRLSISPSFVPCLDIACLFWY